MLPVAAGGETRLGVGTTLNVRQRPEHALFYPIFDAYYPVFKAHLASAGTNLPESARAAARAADDLACANAATFDCGIVVQAINPECLVTPASTV